jgi:hypothetical protein
VVAAVSAARMHGKLIASLFRNPKNEENPKLKTRLVQQRTLGTFEFGI